VIVLKECKTGECQNKLQQVQLKEHGKEKEHGKRWRDEVEEGLNIMIKKGQAMARDRSEWRKSVLGATVHKGL
jgi:hypothetical protein